MNYNFKKHLEECLRNDYEAILNEQVPELLARPEVGPKRPTTLKPGQGVLKPGFELEVGPEEVDVDEVLQDILGGFPPGWTVNVWQGHEGWYIIRDADGNVYKIIHVGNDGIYGTMDDSDYPPGSYWYNGNVITPALPPGCQGTSCAWPAGTHFADGFFHPNEAYLVSVGLPANLVWGPQGQNRWWVYDSDLGVYVEWNPANSGTDYTEGMPTDLGGFQGWWNSQPWYVQAAIMAGIAVGAYFLTDAIMNWLDDDDANPPPTGPPPPIDPPTGDDDPPPPDPPSEPPPADDPSPPDDPPDDPPPPDDPTDVPGDDDDDDPGPPLP